ncbi:bifunctional glycosyltransferase family 2 protein/CDP-glycerol:glycerophosphate glycerophosphotransferase [Streptomyces sp. JV176]|uniref:bifunctional glycosyltransferase/CDP-glycerol:glycerophosphate glycerophosphotransferase n=1 Tax=Streptomyces sp. JV176 TaxID=858630 RepID=UPI002E761665|nr:bifunctional glycosyltransferase family 2 protein/CDP-glycerol:glycerophosphate glycerophosphotransferase [Streptomyces sp. JV176]MEE1802300.1 bifunctional glycosyltransferase family 2 protein/CDP-glycerol:glycerophosphate glycerophosphotransferase [Streptomyces sp. JV176]
MPRFSVIVPAHQVQAYLTECLESVLSQAHDDLELIAVDDGSTDSCGAIIDAFAARDPRVSAVRLPDRTGPGPARNAGLARATGDYVLFLDGADTLVPGALGWIGDRLKETEGPDVLVHDYVRTDDRTGETVRNAFAASLGQEGSAAFRLADRPGLLTYLMTATNKAYRREFVAREGLAFPPGRHADLAWTYPALMTAGTIATLDRVCVRLRHRDEAAEPAGALEVFAPYERVFAFVEERPALARWRPVLHRRMLDHLAALGGLVPLAATDGPLPDGALPGGPLPRRVRAAFFRAARAHHRRYRAPRASPVPHTSEGAAAGAPPRHTLLLRLGAHRTYGMLRAARAVRGRATRGARAARRAARAVALRLHYGIQRRLPVRADRAVFASRSTGHGAGHGTGRPSAYGYGGDPAAVEETVRELVPRLRTSWITDPAHAHLVPTGTRRVFAGSFPHWTALARSRYLVSDAGFDPRLVKRRGQILLQTHDGTPVGSTGLDLLDRPAVAGAADIARLLADAARWDYSLSANRHSTLVRERTCPSPAATLEYGRPRTDAFHRATPADIARLRESLSVPEGFTAVLYAPAYRDYRRTQRLPFDLERVAQSLGPRFVLLVRAHPGYGAPVPCPPHPRITDVSGHPSVETLCLASDVLLTDYSSLMVDYAALDRPIVLHHDDREAYEAARGTCLDLRACPPGAIARTQDELIDIFTSGHWRGSRSAELRAAFRARFCPYDDGRAAERVVRHVFLSDGSAPDRHRISG